MCVLSNSKTRGGGGMGWGETELLLGTRVPLSIYEGAGGGVLNLFPNVSSVEQTKARRAETQVPFQKRATDPEEIWRIDFPPPQPQFPQTRLTWPWPLRYELVERGRKKKS